ncbi:MAG: hypothetical protein N3G19_02680 [Candidatus Pacearchaeota archaeon]|nr:hypothetical protein [Candidatus Pacearchaeota archaeon]
MIKNIKNNKDEIKMKDYILHYSCNAPKEEILDHYKIIPVGEQYGRQSREMLLIPKKLLEKKGYSLKGDQLSISSSCEHLLVKIEEEYKRKYEKQK